MSIETEKVALPLWLLILVGVVAVTIMMAVWYYWIDEQNVKMIGIVGGVVSGLVVAILTSATTVRLVQKVDYYNQMGIKAVLAIVMIKNITAASSPELKKTSG